jgi:stage II sporulation protein D
VRLASLGTPSRLELHSAKPIRVTDPASGESFESTEGELSVSAAGKEVKAGRLTATSLRVEAEVLAFQIGKAPHAYPTALLLTASRGALSLTNECSLEQYTEGVLAGECPSLFHPEAIRAMAIAARSYSYRKGYLGGELCDTTHCQVFRGCQGIKPSIHEAVTATAGLCALYEGEVIDAVYSSDCGGYTEANENAWKGAKPVPYLRAVEDAPEPQGEAFCAVNRSHGWTLALTRARLQSLFGKPDRSVKLAVVETSESGRVRRLQLEHESAENDDSTETAAPAALKTAQRPRIFSGDEWRRLLGLSSVKSLKFEVVESDAGVQLSGHGYGHGVGLCQFGANGMARQGYAYPEIIQHYYTGVSIAPAPTVAEAQARSSQKRMASRKAPATPAMPSGGE